MSTAEQAAREGRVEFTGSRHELMLIMLRGYALMIPTIGLYRFWQATWKRRFYWQNTVIDGDPLEYTGTASQLLLGFFFALAFFLPIYVALFYASMQDRAITGYVYLAAGAVLWFLVGYGIYRARDFRLSRTLWRGIRFDMRGNAWAYALRRFLWSILMLVTLGLIYPWMGASLWRYRWRNTWYGDRRFETSGNWRSYGLPYYVTYFANVIAIGVTTVFIASGRDVIHIDNLNLPGPTALLGCVACLFVLALTVAWYRGTVAARMLSTVTLGDSKLAVGVPPFSLFGQFAAYVVGLVALLLVVALTILLVLAAIYLVAPEAGRAAEAGLVTIGQSGTVTVVLLIATYLAILGALGLLWELIPGIGWWRLLASGATIANVDSLRTVKATAEDRTLVGQGVADALNVGAY